MNRQFVLGGIIGAVAITAIGGVAGFKLLDEDGYAEVVAVQPVTKTVNVPREVCGEEIVERRAPVKDEKQIAGTVAGAVIGDGLDLQGGAYDCAVPADAESVQLNFTAVNPNGFGYLRAWPYGLSEPQATLMAFTEGPGISNSLSLQICNDCVKDFHVKIYGAATHLAVEVLGYYRALAP